MARRQSEKDVSKQVKATIRPEPPRPVNDAVRSLELRLNAIERERDTIKAALVAAEAQIKSLEERQTEVANRIAWTLDNLHSLLEEKS